MIKILLTSLLMLSASLVFSDNRIAFIVGNEAYEKNPLENPVKDAESLNEILQEYGFETYLETNINQKKFYESLETVRQRIKTLGSDTTVLFYFSGHGVEAKGKNFLIPIEASKKVKDESDLSWYTIEVDDVIEGTKAARTRIIILDACRENPFRKVKGSKGGLGNIIAPTGTFIAYATAPGRVAEDGGEEGGIYTGAIVKLLKNPDPTLDIEGIFKEVLVNVKSKTAGRQEPHYTSSLTGKFNFLPSEPRDQPERLFFTHDRWQYSCALKASGESLCKEENGRICNKVISADIEIEPTHELARKRYHSKEFSGEWSPWQKVNWNKPDYDWNDWEVEYPLLQGKRQESGSLNREGGFLFTSIQSEPQRIDLSGGCKIMAITPVNEDKSHVLPRIYKDQQVNKNIVEKAENYLLDQLGENGKEDITNLIGLYAELPKEMAASMYGLAIRNGELRIKNGCYEKKCNYSFSPNYQLAFQLFLYAIQSGNQAAALELSWFYRYGHFTDKDISVAYDLAKLAGENGRMEYWVEINKWGQELLNETLNLDLRVDGKLGPKTCLATTRYFWKTYNHYLCGEVFLKSTLLRITNFTTVE